MDNVKDYVELIKAPWGSMFYDLLFIQLNILQTPKLSILDFGSGLGVTSNHFSAAHYVTAIEPNDEMIKSSKKENIYEQIHGGIEKLSAYEDNSFDMIFCHNVLEYIEEKEPIIAELLRVLKHGGTLSVVKHNRAGRVFHSAVFWNDPKKAIELSNPNANDKSNYLGTQYIYSNTDMLTWTKKHGGKIKKIMGMRAFWALGQDNTVRYTDEWYKNMLALESSVSEIEEYKNAAFYNHLLIEKESSEERRARIYPIILSEYNTEWPEWFSEEKANLERLIGTENIERISHYGSTSVKGLVAKPTIDILLEIKEATDIDKLISALPPSEYICLTKDLLTVQTPPPHLTILKGYMPNGFAKKVYHIHVCYPYDWDELHFRDYLIGNPDTAAEYAALKLKLFKNYEHDRDGYTQAKTEFIKKINKLAREQKS